MDLQPDKQLLNVHLLQILEQLTELEIKYHQKLKEMVQ
jgi:hypothetical protein